MHGTAHLAYGFIIAEIIFYLYIRKTGEAKRYNRPLFWIIGAIGGWSPDMDSLGGFFEDLFTGNPVTYDSFLTYHRQFSHSIIFLVTTLFCTVWLLYYIKKTYRKEKNENWKEINPLGEMPPKSNWITLLSFLLLIVAFAWYNAMTKYIITFIILAATVFFAWSYKKVDKPFYGLVFFLGNISHHLLDAFKCEWNPFGPWRGDIEIGFFTYCREYGPSEFYRQVMTFIFEKIPLFIVLALIILFIVTFIRYRKRKKNQK